MKKDKTGAQAPEYPLRAIRRACVPLASIETADPAATTRACLAALDGKAKGNDAVPLASWDICNGLSGMNAPGAEAVSWYDAQAMQLPDILKGLGDNAKRLAGGLVFLHNLQRFTDRDGVAQGLWNLRDKFKAVGATCLLVGPSLKLPPELQSDIVQIVEPVPDRAAVDAIVESTLKDATGGGRRAAGGSLFARCPAHDVIRAGRTTYFVTVNITKEKGKRMKEINLSETFRWHDGPSGEVWWFAVGVVRQGLRTLGKKPNTALTVEEARQVLRLNFEARNPAHVAAADITEPLLAAEFFNKATGCDEGLIMDGWHRLERFVQLVDAGELPPDATMPAHIIPADVMKLPPETAALCEMEVAMRAAATA